MEEGTILQWLKQLGDEVAVGDELVEIETDKANMAYESDVAGTLERDPVAGGRDGADRDADCAGRGCRSDDRGTRPRPRVLSRGGGVHPVAGLAGGVRSR